MNSKGDKRAQEFSQENEWKNAGAMGEPIASTPQGRVITFKQANRLHAIASENGWNEAAKLKLLSSYGYQNTGEVCFADYQKIINTLEDKAMQSRFQLLVQQV